MAEIKTITFRCGECDVTLNGEADTIAIATDTSTVVMPLSLLKNMLSTASMLKR